MSSSTDQQGPLVTPPQDTSSRPSGALASKIIALAGTPDDASTIDIELAAIAQLAADTLGPVSYASVTAIRDAGHTTVAATSELAHAVDQAQYTDNSGPCLQALTDGTPVRVDDIDATMTWPGFRAAAAKLGLHASLSVPLFAGSGTTVAVLNLYGHDPVTMIALSGHVWTIYDSDPAAGPTRDMPLAGNGEEDLVAGLTAAFEVRALIQRAIGVVIAERVCSAEDAYLQLQLQAAETGSTLTEIATSLLQTDRRRGHTEPGA
jgi:hypothetical protein